MKIIFTALLTAILFLGCNSKDSENENIEAKLVVGKSLALNLKDQNEKAHSLDDSTTKVIFAFSKDIGHTCNDFFVTKNPSFLSDNNTQFVADISGAPSLIRSMFIIPGLKDFKHTVLVLDDKDIAASYKAKVDSEKIIVVYVENKIIKSIKSLNSVAELTTELKN